MYNYQKQLDRIVTFLKKHENNNNLIGAEFEFIITDKDFNSISYQQESGIKSILTHIKLKYNWNSLLEKGELIGLEKAGNTITLEPGSQFEISLRPFSNTQDIEEEYNKVIAEIVSVLNEFQYNLVAIGYHPKTTIKEIPWLPKERYKYMSEHLIKKGSMAHNMMKGSASTQVSFDYTDEVDFQEKLHLGNILSPIIYSIFDNSPTFEGETYPTNSLRSKIWANCDDDRCGVINSVFDQNFGYESYANYILDLVPIIVKESDNSFSPYYNKISTLLDPETVTDDQIEHLLGMCFPDVRVKKYIEIRMADSLPAPYNFSLISFYKIIFADSKNFRRIYNLYKHFTLEEVIESKSNLAELGLNNRLGNLTMIEHFNNILDTLWDNLSVEDQGYLIPMKNLINKESNLKLEVTQLIKCCPILALTKLTVNRDECLESCCNH